MPKPNEVGVLTAATTTFHDLVITKHPTAPRFEVAECLKCDLHQVFHRTLEDKSFKDKPCIVTRASESQTKETAE